MPFYIYMWTNKIIDHIHQHGITADEFEGIVSDPERTTISRSSGLPAAVGRTSTGKYIICIYELEDDDITVIPKTAYEIGD